METSQMSDLVETLGNLELGELVQVTLDDESTITGESSLIDYDPNKRLRIEIEEGNDSRVRHDIRAERENDEWTTPQARRYTPDENDWTVLGAVTAVHSESV